MPTLPSLASSLLLASGLLLVAACSSTSAASVDDAGSVADAHQVVDASGDGATTDSGGPACSDTVPCGPNPGAACARVCKDGSNPCSYACVNHQCVSRGCPEDVVVDGGTPGCNPACGAGETCVRNQLNGGAQMLVSDAGTCPPDYHVNGNFCQRNPTYTCKTTPASCNGTATCACASSLCDGSQCVGASTGQLDCELNAP